MLSVRRSLFTAGLAGFALAGGPTAHAQTRPVLLASAAADVQHLSIEELANVEITSVSKAAQPLSSAAAAVYVITGDDIEQAGANSLPEMLQLAPNLEVMQTSPAAWDITARGFNGNNPDQNFPDKLLVLIDGRSVYTPLYSGVYWDMPDVLPQDVERIEVISGPGGTLWGANAVNGVINVITRKSADTAGGTLTLGAGDQYAGAALQYGGKLDDDLDYRVYASDFYQRAFNNSAGVNAGDGWGRPQGGFRLDWSPGGEVLSLSGDIYGGTEGQGAGDNQRISGANLTAHWTHPLDDASSLQMMAYFDQTRRSVVDGGAFTLNTYDFEAQHNFSLGSWNNIVWGIGERIYQYRITDRLSAASSLIFSPEARTLNLADIFAEDHIPLSGSVQLSVGLKLEDDPYSGVSLMPSGRLSWQVNRDHLVWAAVSHAVRSPTPFDADVVEKLGATTFITGNADFRPEQVTAYELGYRGQITADTSLSVTLFEDAYQDLKTLEPDPTTTIPLYWGNGMEGNVHGVEIWGSYQALDWWRLSAGFAAQHEDLKFAPGASGLLGVQQAGDDPHHWASLRSSMRLMDGVNLETDLRYVGELPDPKVPEYVEMNARIGWRVSDTLTLAVSGYNLLHGQHLEYPGADMIRRSVYLETRLRF